MGTKKWEKDRPSIVVPPPESLAFLDLPAGVNRTHVKVLDIPGKYLSIKSDVPLDLFYQQTAIHIDVAKEIRHSFKEVFLTNHASLGGRIKIAYSNSENLSCRFQDDDIEVFLNYLLQPDTPTNFTFWYPSYMKSAHVWLYATAGLIQLDIDDEIFDLTETYTTSYVLQPTIFVNPGMFSYNLIEGDRLSVTLESTGTPNVRFFLRFRKGC